MSKDQTEEKGISGETGDNKEAKPRDEIQTGRPRDTENFPDTDDVPPPGILCGFPC